MWDPQRLTTLWACTACYRDSFTLPLPYPERLYLPTAYTVGIGRKDSQDMKLSTYPHIVQKLWIRGAIPPLPHACIMVSCLMKHRDDFIFTLATDLRTPVWSSCQSSWLQIQRSRIQFPALPDFLSSSGSGTGLTQSREDNWGTTWKESRGSSLENRN
jgi:hypothetical protein